jgi:hypothetical protein
LIRSRRRAHRRCITQVRPAAGELEQRTVAPTVATTSTEWSPAERLVSGPAPRQGASRPSVDSQSVWRETPSLSTRLREHVREEVDLVGSPCSPLWLAEYRASQPIRAVDLHHALGHDRGFSSAIDHRVLRVQVQPSREGIAVGRAGAATRESPARAEQERSMRAKTALVAVR